MAENIQNIRDRESEFSIIDDDLGQSVHVIKFTTADGEMGNLYIEVDDDELHSAIEEFDGVNREGEKLSFFSDEDIAMNVRDKLRAVTTREKIIELAKRKRKLIPKLDELDRLEEMVDLSDFPILELSQQKQEAEEQLQEIEQEFDALITRE